MKKIIVSIIAIVGVCCYLDKADKKLNDITSNDNVVYVFEGMKKAGNIINNSEAYENIRNTTSTMVNSVKENPEVKDTAKEVYNTVNIIIEKIKSNKSI